MNLSILYKKLTNRKYTIGYKYVLSLLIGFIGITSFCSAEEIIGNFKDSISGGNGDGIDNNTYYLNNTTNSNNYGLRLIMVNSGDIAYSQIYYTLSNGSQSQTNIYIYSNQIFDTFTWCQNKSNCAFVRGVHIRYIMEVGGMNYGKHGYLSGYLYTNGQSSGGGNSSCPEVDTGAILSGYVPENQLNSCNSDLNSCQTDLNSCQNNTSGFNDLLNNCSNNLNACNNSLTSCLQQNCPETVTGTNRSSLFINNIQYPGAATIKFTIPEEIERDQYIDEEETNIDVIGYGYDQEKMQRMVNTQHYKPTAEEMSGLMEKVADFIPLVAVALLIARIRRVIKKVF